MFLRCVTNKQNSTYESCHRHDRWQYISDRFYLIYEVFYAISELASVSGGASNSSAITILYCNCSDELC